MKEFLKNHIWLWCLINSIMIFLMAFGLFVTDDVYKARMQSIDENKQDIEKIEYRLSQKDSVVIINNVYYEKVKVNDNKTH